MHVHCENPHFYQVNASEAILSAGGPGKDVDMPGKVAYS
jgi:hypothetical protein